MQPVQTRVAFWREFDRDTQAAWFVNGLAKSVRDEYEKKAGNTVVSTSLGTGNWLLDNQLVNIGQCREEKDAARPPGQLQRLALRRVQ
jgi:hypothetical protein